MNNEPNLVKAYTNGMLQSMTIMNDKYYIPEIEELHVGYECEIYSNKWNSYIIPDKMYFLADNTENNTGGFNNFIFPILIKNAEIRTKYLDKEDIESLGWNFDAYKEDDYKYYLNSYILYFPYADEEPILIKDQKGTLFYGECKSINELKTIMRLLKIK